MVVINVTGPLGEILGHVGLSTAAFWSWGLIQSQNLLAFIEIVFHLNHPWRTTTAPQTIMEDPQGQIKVMNKEKPGPVMGMCGETRRITAKPNW